LARAGCNIDLHGLEEAGAVEGRQEELGWLHGVNVAFMRADLLDPQAITAMMDQIVQKHGGVDVLVNNAVTRHFDPIETLSVASWDKALAVNLSAAFHTIRLSLPAMRARAWGRIFNMTSVYSTRAVVNRIGYITTKTALVGMTRAVAMETINQGITCNAICSGSVITPDIQARVQALMHEKSIDQEATTRCSCWASSRSSASWKHRMSLIWWYFCACPQGETSLGPHCLWRVDGWRVESQRSWQAGSERTACAFCCGC